MSFNKRSISSRKKALRSVAGKRFSRLWILVLTLIVIVVTGGGIIGVSAMYGTYRGILETSPDIGTIDVSPKGYSTFVYDNKGGKIATLVSTDSNRIPVDETGIPDNLANAFVAIEDERFYQHSGIDIPGIFRAAYVGLTSGFDFTEGASTITQQLIKNNVFTNWTNETTQDRIKRKIQEQYLAYELEKNMHKSEILLNYLNTINLGHNTLGVEAASQRYFDKHAADLTLAECAVLAAITQNPSAYDPIVFPDDNHERQKVVLEHMYSQGFITKKEYTEALEEDVYAKIQNINKDKEKVDNRVNSYFVDALIRQVLRDLKDEDLIVDKSFNNGNPLTDDEAYALLYSGGLRIYSTQDPKIQAIVDKQCSENSGNYPEDTLYYLNYALTVTAPDGSQTNYDSNSLESWFLDRDESYSILYKSKSRAKEDVEAFRKAVVGPEDTYEENYELAPQPEISVTVADQKTGYVVAMLGGRGEKEASRTLNRATDTTRQPGSTFKVISTFSAALDSARAKDVNGMPFTLASTQVDEKYAYDNGVEVHNWYEKEEKRYRGIQTMRNAIRDSLNIVTVKFLTQITPRVGFEYAENLGINTLVDDEEINGKIFSDVNQTLALGGITFGVRNIELNAAFSTIANGGEYIVPRLYTKVTMVNESRDSHGGVTEAETVLLDNTKPEKERVLKKTTCWLLTSAMKDVVKEPGTGTPAYFSTTAIAGKTGTTEESNDVWFSGYSPNYTATVWAGYDNNTKLNKTEELLAMTIWRQIMSNIDANKKYSDFERPKGIVEKVVCAETGLLPVSKYCSHTYTEYFVKGTEPTATCYLGSKKKKEEEEKRRKKEQEEKEEAERKAREQKEKEEREKKKNEEEEEEEDEEDGKTNRGTSRPGRSSRDEEDEDEDE